MDATTPGGNVPLFPPGRARVATFLDDSAPNEYPLCVPYRVLIDGDDVTRHVLPGRLLTPVRQVGRRRPIQPWGIDSAAGAVTVWLVVRPETVTVDDLGRQITFAGHNLLTPPAAEAVEDLGEVELVPGHATVRTIAEPWREKALLLRFYAESVEFRPGRPAAG
jgi:hypothetical protein